MGLAFPIALHIAASSAVSLTAFDLARRVGRLYSSNVLGAIGALIGGFVLIPLRNACRPYRAGCRIRCKRRRSDRESHPKRRRLQVAAAVAALVFVVLAREVPDPFRAAYARRYGRDMREFWREEARKRRSACT